MKKFFLSCLVLPLALAATVQAAPSTWVYYGTNGLLNYQTWSNGNRIMDFSHAGYMGGGVALPNVATVQTLNPSGGDDKTALQNAINAVAALPLVNGVRGALQLGPGTFLVSGQININASGVVLRGAGSTTNGGTTIRMTNAASFTLFNIAGSGSASQSGTVSITNSYVPSGTTTFNVSSASGFSVGDNVMIRRTVTTNWIHYLGMDTLVRDGATQTWISAGTVITTDRKIKQISGNQITLDVPLTDSFDSVYLGNPAGAMAKYTWSGRISQVGFEHLRIEAPPVVSGYTAVSMDDIIDSWARDVFIQDGVNCFNVSKDCKRITVDQVVTWHTVVSTASAAPSDFACTGTQILFNKCEAHGTGLWPFVTHTTGTGPIVVLNFYSNGRGISPHQRWCTGVLTDSSTMDNSTSGNQGISYRNRGTSGSGHGWTTGWSVAWNCTTPYFLVSAAPGTENWSIGGIGTITSRVSSGDPDGIYDAHGAHVSLGASGSLYLEQLRERLGNQALANIGYGLPDFTVTAEPEVQNVNIGSATAFTVTVNALNGFNSNVVFGVNNLPSGMSAGFTPPSVLASGSSTMTLTVSNSALAANYLLDVTGTGSGMIHTSTVEVVTHNFSVAATPGSQTVAAGSNAVYIVTLATNGNFSGGTIGFDVNPLAPGITASFSPPTLNGPGTTTLTLTTTSNTPGGLYGFGVTGTNACCYAYTNIYLTVIGGSASPGTLVWTGDGGDTNWSTMFNWTNITAGGNGAPGGSNDVMFLDTGAASTSNAVNNTVNGDTTVRAGFWMNTNGFHTTEIAAGRTLNIDAVAAAVVSVLVGTETDNGSTQTVTVRITGPGAALNFNGGSAFVRQGSVNSGSVRATLDLSTLDTFTASQNRLVIGSEGGVARPAGTFLLAKTNTLTLLGSTPAIAIGGAGGGSGNSGGTSHLYLGQVNRIFADSLLVGRVKQSSSLIAFNRTLTNADPLLGPSAYFRATNGTGRVPSWTFADSGTGGGTVNTGGTADFSGGTVDALVDVLTLAKSSTGSGAGNPTGTLTFNAGTIDVNTLLVGYQASSAPNGGSNFSTGVVNINGGTLIVNTLLQLGLTTGGPGATNTSGTLNLNGGTVQANAIVNGGGIANINVNGGILTVANTAGTPARGLNTLSLTNGLLHFALNANAVLTNYTATNLNAVGLTTITIDSVANVNPAATNRFPLIRYVTFNGSVGANFVLDDLPGNLAGSLSNNAATKTIELLVAPAPVAVPLINAVTFSAIDGTLHLSGTNGSPGASYHVLASPNVALPLTNWTPVGSDLFDVDGTFDFTVSIPPPALQQFYILQIP